MAAAPTSAAASASASASDPAVQAILALPEVAAFVEANRELIKAVGFRPAVDPRTYFQAPVLKGPGRHLKVRQPDEPNKPFGQFLWSDDKHVRPIWSGLVSTFSTDDEQMTRRVEKKRTPKWRLNLSSGPRESSKNPFTLSDTSQTYLYRIQTDFEYVLMRAALYATLAKPHPRCQCEQLHTFQVGELKAADFAEYTEVPQGALCDAFLERTLTPECKTSTHRPYQVAEIGGRTAAWTTFETRMFEEGTITQKTGELDKKGREIMRKVAVPTTDALPEEGGEFSALRDFIQSQMDAGQRFIAPNVYLRDNAGLDVVEARGDERFRIYPGAQVLVETGFAWCLATSRQNAFTFTLPIESITLVKQGEKSRERAEPTLEELMERRMRPRAPPSSAVREFMQRTLSNAVPVNGTQ